MLADGLAPVQRAVRDAEFATVHSRSFSPLIVPGLLQTERYIRAVLQQVSQVYGPEDDDLDEAVAARLNRQDVLAAPGHSWHHVLLEQVLWSPHGSLDLWGEQLTRLAEVARGAVPSYRLGVIKRGTVWAGAIPNMSVQFTISDDREVGLELPHTFLVPTDPDEIASYVCAFDCADRLAVYGEEAAAVIEAAAEQMGVG
ncbi:Scr1 family TA system antitoxin-like transcriptional regulator [Actinomadura rupiterrae]|uniref:Scr1 family TA system antitoxin-like transcriptional regulator n=1 Tax=Actinomadura rupiterrae TaxID=559627 RepID=UPI0020A5A85D|nr:Scr1 family TA system antitoxin-like transcriptional regulator [Actinomadura rupiterrae]MCP2342964.1 hypothetical protein [Actinomadura rupiterrae]